jgi:hypothetical protein
MVISLLLTSVGVRAVRAQEGDLSLHENVTHTRVLHSDSRFLYSKGVSRVAFPSLCYHPSVWRVRPGARPRGSVGHADLDMGLPQKQ